MPLPPQAQTSTFRWVSGRTVAPSTGQILCGPTIVSSLTASTQFNFIAPMFTMSPVASTGMVTTGILFQLQHAVRTTLAVPGGGGFTVTPWIFDPFGGFWASGTAFTADYGQVFTTFDFDASGLYFTLDNISVDGSLMIGIAEQ